MTLIFPPILAHNFPYWKHLLSYVYDILLEQSSSPYNNVLEVLLSKGRIRLNGANVTYSYADLYDNFFKTFVHIQATQKKFSNVLVLGFGLGSIPYMLEQKFGQKAHYIGVEIDAEVVRLAQKYIPINLQTSIELHCADAYTFVQNKHNTYDLITVDIFIDKHIPEQFKTIDFLQNLKAQLAPQGYLIYNTLALTPNMAKDAQDFFNKIFCPIFANSYLLDCTSNLMLVYQNNN